MRLKRIYIDKIDVKESHQSSNWKKLCAREAREKIKSLFHSERESIIEVNRIQYYSRREDGVLTNPFLFFLFYFFFFLFLSLIPSEMGGKPCNARLEPSCLSTATAKRWRCERRLQAACQRTGGDRKAR